MIQNIEYRIQSSLSVTHMHSHQPRCVAEQTGSAGCGSQGDQLFPARIGASVVRYSYLHTDHRRNQDDIALYASGQGGRRVTVGAGQCIHGHAFLGQGTGLCY